MICAIKLSVFLFSVDPTEADQTSLILQELRAIKQSLAEQKQESGVVKRRQAYMMLYTKTIANKLEDVIDSEIDAFRFPVTKFSQVEKMEQNLKHLRYTEKLVRRVGLAVDKFSNLDAYFFLLSISFFLFGI